VEELVIGGTRVGGSYAFGPIPERGGVNAVAGDAVIEVARRGGHDIVRPRHPGHPLRVRFAGVPACEPDLRWVIPARFVRFAEPRPTTCLLPPAENHLAIAVEAGEKLPYEPAS
jgi:uncharacterized protein (DUF1684 family)